MPRKKTIMLLVTHQCNLHCSYCYESHKDCVTMTAKQAEQYISSIVGSLDSFYTEFEVQFMGGEPLLQFNLIREVSEWLWKESFPLPLTVVFAPTNGTLLNEEMKKWFSLNKEKVCLGLSFDGNRLMQNINRSNSSPLVDLDYFLKTWPNQSVKMTISPETVQMLYDGVVFLHEKGFRHITTDLAMGNNVKWENQHLCAFEEQLDKLGEYYLSHPELQRFSMLNLCVEDLFQPHYSLKKCGCGEDLVCIDTDGVQYACHLFSPISASKEEAETSLSIDFNNHQEFISNECQECILYPICTSCYGMNFLCYGDVSKQSAFTCQAFKIQFYANCKLLYECAQSNNDKQTILLIDKIITEIEGNYGKDTVENSKI